MDPEDKKSALVPGSNDQKRRVKFDRYYTRRVTRHIKHYTQSRELEAQLDDTYEFNPNSKFCLFFQ